MSNNLSSNLSNNALNDALNNASNNQIGLANTEVSAVIEKLNALLSSYQVFYTNVRGYHWNVKGEHFFSLHVKFEELYNEIVLQVDEIAERILTLGGTPLHAYSDFIQHTFIEEHKNVFAGRDCVQGVVTSLQTLIKKQRELAEFAEEAGDQGSADLVTEYYQAQEKHVWMYNAFLG